MTHRSRPAARPTHGRRPSVRARASPAPSFARILSHIVTDAVTGCSGARRGRRAPGGQLRGAATAAPRMSDNDDMARFLADQKRALDCKKSDSFEVDGIIQSMSVQEVSVIVWPVSWLVRGPGKVWYAMYDEAWFSALSFESEDAVRAWCAKHKFGIGCFTELKDGHGNVTDWRVSWPLSKVDMAGWSVVPCSAAHQKGSNLFALRNKDAPGADVWVKQPGLSSEFKKRKL